MQEESILYCFPYLRKRLVLKPKVFFFWSFENPILQGTKKEIVRLCPKEENHPFTHLRDNLFFRMIKEYEVIRWLNISICFSNIQFVWLKYDSWVNGTFQLVGLGSFSCRYHNWTYERNQKRFWPMKWHNDFETLYLQFWKLLRFSFLNSLLAPSVYHLWWYFLLMWESISLLYNFFFSDKWPFLLKLASLYEYMGLPGGSVVKNPPASAGDGFNPSVRKILWRRKCQPTAVFLPWKSHGQRSLVDYSSWGHKETWVHDWTHIHTWRHMYIQTHTDTIYVWSKPVPNSTHGMLTCFEYSFFENNS